MSESRKAGTHWEMTVKITYPVLPSDCEVKYRGDAEIDFASRSSERIRRLLQGLVESVDGGYLIIPVNNQGQIVRRCYD